MADPVAVPANRTNVPRLLSYRWELLLWLWLAFFFNQADRQVFGTVLPMITLELGLTDVQAGLIASIFTAALALCVPIAGYVGDVCNRARVITLAVFGWSLATLLSGFGTSLGYLIAVRSVATGAGEAFYAPAANALIAEHHVETRARAIAVHQTALYAGVIASGLIAGWLADQFGWRAAFWVFGACGIVLSVVLTWRLRLGHASQVRPPALRFTDALVVLLRPTVMLLTLAFACMVFVNIGFLTWMPTYLHEQFGLSLASAGFSSMVYHHLGAVGGVALGGFLSDRWGSRQPRARLLLQAFALLAGAPFIWMLGSTAGLTTLFVVLAAFGIFRGIYDAGIYASLFEVIEPRLRATVVGLVIALAYLVGAFAPVALGFLKGTVGLSLSFSLLGGVYAVGGIAVIVAARFFFRNDHQLATSS